MQLLMFYRLAFKDIYESFLNITLVATLAWQDIKQRYRRSFIGPFWLTLSTGFIIGGMGLVFGQIFKTPMQEYLPFLAAGMILWSFVTTTISEGCMSFINADAIIKQLPIPLYSHILRVVARNLFILGHNLVLIPLVMLLVGANITIGLNLLFFVLGLTLLIINLLWMTLLIATLSTRFRDLSQIINSAMQMVFYVTPIMWQPNLMTHKTGISLLNFNPFYHLFEIVRAPILNQSASILNWQISILLAITGWIFAFLVYGRYKHRIAYWL